MMTLSILGMYEYNPDVFDELKIPDGIDKDILIDSIIYGDCAELEILYPDSHFLKRIIGSWSRKEYGIWKKLYETTQLEYNPIHNYDRTETSEDLETRNLSETEKEKRNLTRASEGERGSTNATNGESKVENIGGVSGYNDEGFVNRDKSDSKVDDKLSTSLNENYEDEVRDSGTVDRDKSDTGTVGNKREMRAFGNIGVTTTQQMLEAERNVVKFNIYDYIVQSFKERFCIVVY